MATRKFDGTLGSVQIAGVQLIMGYVAGALVQYSAARAEQRLAKIRDYIKKQNNDIEFLQKFIKEHEGKTVFELAHALQNENSQEIKGFMELLGENPAPDKIKQFTDKHGPLLMYFLLIMGLQPVDSTTDVCAMADGLKPEDIEKAMAAYKEQTPPPVANLDKAKENIIADLKGVKGQKLATDIRKAVGLRVFTPTATAESLHPAAHMVSGHDFTTAGYW